MAEIRINATGELKLYDSDDSNYVSFKSAGTVSSNVAWVLPSADGSSGQMLSTDGSGTLSWATASSADPSSADGDSLGTASAEWSDLYLADGGIVYFGNDQDIRLIHNADKGLILKHSATADDKPVSLTLQTGETDIAQDDIIGKLDFQAPDEGTGTDAILVAAGIEAVSEGDFSSSNNATKLSFKTAASEAAAEKMSLSSGGNLDVTGDITGATLNADGDTSAGDNAAIGYTAAEGLILTGQGSTDDITVKNDADTTVLNVATGATDVEVSAGNIFFGTADKGIYLGVTSANANNLLADYEEGNWTPTVTTGGANPDFSSGTQIGRYVKVGKMVHVHCEMKYTSSSSNTGQWGGLPFNLHADANFTQTGILVDDRNTTTYHMNFIQDDTKWYLRAQGTVSGGLQSPSDFSGQVMRFNTTYIST